MRNIDQDEPPIPSSRGNPESHPRDEGSGIPDSWAPLVRRIQQGDQTAMEELYRTFCRGIRYYLSRHLGASEEIEDRVHESYVIVVQAIRKGEIRDPERLMGFVRTIARRQVAAHIDSAVHERRERADIDLGALIPDQATSPEQNLLHSESVELMQRILRGIPERDREILTRFYLQEQTQEQICAEMGLSETQFRLLKSRAKARFGSMGKRRLELKPSNKIFLRKVASSGHC